jgi:hypothetical protein
MVGSVICVSRASSIALLRMTATLATPRTDKHRR